ncbi:hypothetical protein MMC12_008219 [Toensbergia leucococca]|nr:hypothetical protein [Toensbergia leucococca]
MALSPLPLPSGLSERQITSSASELSYHIIEAGSKGKPLIILVHGFPELAYSWRKVMPGLAEAGFYVVAVDQRGYGRTTGWDNSTFDNVDLRTFSMTNLVRDIVVLVYALGYHGVECIVGHDFGSVPAALCALIRPDLFHKVVLMSHPFGGSPTLPFDVDSRKSEDAKELDVHEELALLPEPRKHYKWYYSTAPANNEMAPPEGLHEFLRGYFHLKSADAHNDPQPLKAWKATELAKMPAYYIMPLQAGMREATSQSMNNEEVKNMQQRHSRWLPDSDIRVYVDEYCRTGFQGGLNWYRVQTDPMWMQDFDMFAGKKMEVPILYVAGVKDWGTYQSPGTLERMPEICTSFKGVKLIEGAGHWVQQEQPQKVVREILSFLSEP